LVLIDRAQIDHQLAIRAITARQLVRKAKVAEATFSRARNGHRLHERTLRKLTEALLSFPIVEGTDLFVAAPEPRRGRGEVGAPSSNAEASGGAVLVEKKHTRVA